MTISYGWLVENQTIYAESKDTLTVSGYEQWIDELHVLFNASEYDTLHIISCAADQKKMPPFYKLTNVQVNKKMGWMIFVGLSDQMLKFISSTVTQQLHMNVKFVNTYEEALTILKRVDMKFPATEPIPRDQVTWLNVIEEEDTEETD